MKQGRFLKLLTQTGVFSRYFGNSGMFTFIGTATELQGRMWQSLVSFSSLHCAFSLVTRDETPIPQLREQGVQLVVCTTHCRPACFHARKSERRGKLVHTQAPFSQQGTLTHRESDYGVQGNSCLTEAPCVGLVHKDLVEKKRRALKHRSTCRRNCHSSHWDWLLIEPKPKGSQMGRSHRTHSCTLLHYF